MMKAEDIHPAIRSLVDEIAALEEVERVFLFGSRARGDHLPRADVDIAVEAPGLPPQKWSRIIEMTESAATLLKIDCVHLDGQSGKFRNAIEQDGVVLYDRKNERTV